MAGTRRLRLSGSCCSISRCGHWITGRRICFWFDRPDYGICHWAHFRLPLKPAVSIGLWAGGRFETKELLPYILAQVIGGLLAGGVLYIIASGQAGFDATTSGFAANGYGAHSPGKYSLTAALVCEIVMTAMFLLVIMGATDKRAPQGFAPIAIGFCLTLIHLISIPVTNTSVNPARSTGVALYVGDWAVAQLWLFWLAPIVGAIIGAWIYRSLLSNDSN